MHRVELKAARQLALKREVYRFLMHRVELKGGGKKTLRTCLPVRS